VRRLAQSAAVLAAAVLAGCGQAEIDEREVEAFMRGYFEPDARSANCPSGVDAEAGETFECTVVDADGRRFRVTAEVIDEEGRVRVSSEDVRPE
jgi:Domain of unknown function (DUF4333)